MFAEVRGERGVRIVRGDGTRGGRYGAVREGRQRRRRSAEDVLRLRWWRVESVGRRRKKRLGGSGVDRILEGLVVVVMGV